MPVVSNASPLIALASIDRLDLLPALYETMTIPSAVAVEILPSVAHRPEWIRVQALAEPQPERIAMSGLGRGEREALSLAIEVRAERVILDDRLARQLGYSLGLRVVGTLGVLLAAKHGGHLELVRPALDELRRQRFFMSPRLYEGILRRAHELDE